MKENLKVLIIFSVCIVMAFFLGSYTYLETKVKIHEDRDKNLEEEKSDILKKDEKKEVKEKKETIDTLEKAYEKSSRINFVLMGMEGIRSDTIIFISFDPKLKKVDMISIPRDTYIYRKGYEEAEQRKINAVYASHGASGVKKVVSHILEGVPVHHYIMIDYKGVEKIVDSVGGVEVTVPFHMKYKDPTAKPPLYIDIPEGKQLLNGKKSVEFLRYRKDNVGKNRYSDGDLGRVKAQQEFLKSFIDEALSIKMPLVIKTSFDYIKTDVSLAEALNYGKSALAMGSEDFNFTTLPGVGTYKKVKNKQLSYFIYDELMVKEIMENIYGVEKKVLMK
ncbi:MAG: Transcriptional attenuator, LytR family [Sporanaerobacter sp.]|jgi:polyisoprenyl-teichoic acid--peptidoglycan teichoic acid transferase|uniref:LCP family protein n=1 Tax=Sporanaerobacter sp. TaxID=2010183 RepID=UPI003A0FC7B6